MGDYIKAQHAVLDKEKQKGTLSFNLADRIKEVGLADFTVEALPSEDAFIRLESAGKAARDQGRMYVGAVDGEDLLANFRPRWSKTPKLDVLVGEGTLEEKMRASLEARKARAIQDWVVLS